MTCANSIASGRFQVLMSSARTAYVSIGIAPAWATRAVVMSVAILDQLPEASMMQKTLYPATSALSAGNAMQTLVRVPAMRSVLRLVFSTASTHFGLSQALIWPVRGMYTASGLYWWI